MPEMTISGNRKVAEVISKYNVNCKLELIFGYMWLKFLKIMGLIY